MNDWRLDNVKRLKGLHFLRKQYKRPSDSRDHDHCAACWATFAESEGRNIQHEGYATGDDYVHGADYDWICLSCFTDLKEEVEWIEVKQRSDLAPLPLGGEGGARSATGEG